MHIFKSISQLQEFRFNSANSAKKIGFVPTMGALHDGHISLVNRSIAENDLAIVSIFVNPTQFNEAAYYSNYPRTEKIDQELLLQVNPDVLFMPSAEEMYQNNEELLKINLNGLDSVMEGKFREGHFAGVVTVVDKFFSIIRPNRAYFGLKDFQQLAIIKYMASKRYPEMEIVPCPIIRDHDGLALSSRNQRLSAHDRSVSVLLSKALFNLHNNWGVMPFDKALSQSKEVLSDSSIELEYLEVVDAQTLEIQHEYSTSQVVACLAARVGNVRLIDNILLPNV